MDYHFTINSDLKKKVSNNYIFQGLTSEFHAYYFGNQVKPNPSNPAFLDSWTDVLIG